MPEHKPQKTTPAPWRAPVALEQIPESGQHFALIADAEQRAAVAQLAGLRSLARLQAEFDVTRHGTGGLRVTGHISATVGQTCVITLEPIANEVEEDIDLVFLPQTAPAQPDGKPEDGPKEAKWDEPEPLIGGAVDLGALATEFVILGLDPYPRKAGAVFDPPRDGKSEESPFAALAPLTKRRDGR